MGKAILLTGAPGVGKSTLRKQLSKTFKGLETYDYGELLRQRKASAGVSLEYTELRDRSATVVKPEDVANTDEWVISRIGEIRATADILIDSHALTSEEYGLRAIPFSMGQLSRLKLDAILVLRCDPEVLVARNNANPEGRRKVGVDLMRELQILQESVGLAYATACGCPFFAIDVTTRDERAVADTAILVLRTIHMGIPNDSPL